MKEKTPSRASKVRLARGRRLRVEADGERHVLVSRSGRIQLNASATAILRLCNGTRTCDAIVSKVTRSGNAQLTTDVRAFLDAARRRRWIV